MEKKTPSKANRLGSRKKPKAGAQRQLKAIRVRQASREPEKKNRREKRGEEDKKSDLERGTAKIHF